MTVAESPAVPTFAEMVCEHVKQLFQLAHSEVEHAIFVEQMRQDAIAREEARRNYERWFPPRDSSADREATASLLAARQRKLDKIQALADTRRQWMESGDLKFKVEIDGQPQMTSLVGGQSRAEAVAKFKEYWGLVSVNPPSRLTASRAGPKSGK